MRDIVERLCDPFFVEERNPAYVFAAGVGQLFLDERHSHFVSGAIIIVGVIAFAIASIGLKD